jgi:hypothetical protein
MKDDIRKAHKSETNILSKKLREKKYRKTKSGREKHPSCKNSR